MCLRMLRHTTRLLVTLRERILFSPAGHEGQQLYQGQLALREDAPSTYGLSTSALTIGTLPDDGVSLGRVLVDGPESVARFTCAGVCQKLTLCHEFDCVLCGHGGQGQVPQTPLLDEILGLLRNDGRVHQVGR